MKSFFMAALCLPRRKKSRPDKSTIVELTPESFCPSPRQSRASGQCVRQKFCAQFKSRHGACPLKLRLVLVTGPPARSVISRIQGYSRQRTPTHSLLPMTQGGISMRARVRARPRVISRANNFRKKAASINSGSSKFCLTASTREKRMDRGLSGAWPLILAILRCFCREERGAPMPHRVSVG